MIEELKTKILNEFNKEFKDNKFVEIFISKNELYSNEVKDIMGSEMFAETSIKHGWLVFINPNLLENYSHKCYYWLVSNDGIITKNNNGIWFPSDSIELVQL